MNKITGIEVYPLQAKFKKPFSFSGGITRVSSNNIIIKITTSEGIVGIGEACPVPGMSGETDVSICKVIKQYFEPALIGKDPLDFAVLTHQLEKLVGKNVVAKAGVNIALYDLVGKMLNVPIYTLLGGKFRDYIDINGSVGMGTAAEMIATAEEQMAESGVKYLKLYCGRDDIDTDVKKLKEIVKGIGGRAEVFLDVNQQWTTKEAIRAIRMLEEDINIVLIEQPTPSWDLEGLRFVTESVNTPIAADEAVFSIQDISLLALNRACDLITVYAQKPGGILRGHEAIKLSNAMGLDCFMGSYIELGIGTAATAHLAASIPVLKYPCYMYGQFKYEHDVIQEPFDIKNGKFKVPDGPGLGVELDEEKLEYMKAE
ncbi:MAG: hypothetical protein GX834_04410 [Clostridiaceae bacterium]|nr:hypothetical protein [Clostridiaceae bacterium]HZK26089.1 enolase C-terminal domain-like protein [Thermoclostridium sp.]